MGGAFAGYRLVADRNGELQLKVYLVARNRIIGAVVDLVRQIPDLENNWPTGENYPLNVGGLSHEELNRLRQELDYALTLEDGQFDLYLHMPKKSVCDQGIIEISADMGKCFRAAQLSDSEEVMLDKVQAARFSSLPPGGVAALDAAFAQNAGQYYAWFDVPKPVN